MKYTLWRWNGHYIIGDKVYTYKSKQSAETKARTWDDFSTLEKVDKGWLILNDNHMPIGMIEKVNNG